MGRPQPSFHERVRRAQDRTHGWWQELLAQQVRTHPLWLARQGAGPCVTVQALQGRAHMTGSVHACDLGLGSWVLEPGIWSCGSTASLQGWERPTCRIQASACAFLCITLGPISKP